MSEQLYINTMSVDQLRSISEIQKYNCRLGQIQLMHIDIVSFRLFYVNINFCRSISTFADQFQLNCLCQFRIRDQILSYVIGDSECIDQKKNKGSCSANIAEWPVPSHIVRGQLFFWGGGV